MPQTGQEEGDGEKLQTGLRTFAYPQGCEIGQTVTLNIYFISIHLLYYLLNSNDFRSAVITVFLMSLLGRVLNTFFVPAQKLTQHDHL